MRRGTTFSRRSPHVAMGDLRRKKMSVVTGMITLIVFGDLSLFLDQPPGGFPCIPPLLDQLQPTNQTNIQEI